MERYFSELYQLSERENQAGGAGEILEQFLNGAKAEEGKASRMTYPMVEKMALDLLQAFVQEAADPPGVRRHPVDGFHERTAFKPSSSAPWKGTASPPVRMSREGEGRTLESLEPLLLKD